MYKEKHFQGPYLVGPSPSIADAVVFPSMVFYIRTLEKFGRETVEYMGARMERWWVGCYGFVKMKYKKWLDLH